MLPIESTEILNSVPTDYTKILNSINENLINIKDLLKIITDKLPVVEIVLFIVIFSLGLLAGVILFKE